VTERRCHSCRTWYEARLRACPECETPKYAHNTWLAHANMNAALWRQTERVVRDG
jgi:hypothetical protein